MLEECQYWQYGRGCFNMTQRQKTQKGLLLTNMLNHWCHQSPIPAPTPGLEPGNVFESSNEAAQHKATDKMLIHATTLEAEIW